MTRMADEVNLYLFVLILVLVIVGVTWATLTGVNPRLSGCLIDPERSHGRYRMCSALSAHTLEGGRLLCIDPLAILHRR